MLLSALLSLWLCFDAIIALLFANQNERFMIMASRGPEFINIRFFSSQETFRNWLEKNHHKTAELWLGFYKKQSGRKGISYKQALDEALCFGWIDGIRKTIDESSYKIRFTPRKGKSIWSLVNTKRAEELKQSGRMRPSGLNAFAARDPERTGIYSFERATATLDPRLEKKFRANKKAWNFFQAQPPGYRKLMTFRVISAKKEETRHRRLDELIASSEKGIRLSLITGSSKSPKT